jgi:hypothetical protein
MLESRFSLQLRVTYTKLIGFVITKSSLFAVSYLFTKFVVFRHLQCSVMFFAWSVSISGAPARAYVRARACVCVWGWVRR